LVGIIVVCPKRSIIFAVRKIIDMSNKKKKNKEISMIKENDIITELNDFELLVDSFIGIGYSEDEAELAAKNVLIQDEL